MGVSFGFRIDVVIFRTLLFGLFAYAAFLLFGLPLILWMLSRRSYALTSWLLTGALAAFCAAALLFLSLNGASEVKEFLAFGVLFAVFGLLSAAWAWWFIVYRSK